MNRKILYISSTQWQHYMLYFSIFRMELLLVLFQGHDECNMSLSASMTEKQKNLIFKKNTIQYKKKVYAPVREEKSILLLPSWIREQGLAPRDVLPPDLLKLQYTHTKHSSAQIQQVLPDIFTSSNFFGNLTSSPWGFEHTSIKKPECIYQLCSDQAV